MGGGETMVIPLHWSLGYAEGIRQEKRLFCSEIAIAVVIAAYLILM